MAVVKIRVLKHMVECHKNAVEEEVVHLALGRVEQQALALIEAVGNAARCLGENRKMVVIFG